MQRYFKLIAAFIAMAIAGGVLGAAPESGSVIGRHIFGLARDFNNDPVVIGDSALIYGPSAFSQRLSVADKQFEISGFDHLIGGVYITRLDAAKKYYLDTEHVNAANIGGLSRPTAGVLSPWNSLLLAESGTIDAARPASFIQDYKPFYKGKAQMVNPYDHGWISEVVVLDGNGKSKVVKNYAMGRLFAAQVLLMPDGKTVYLRDNKAQGNLYLFVAEQANSLGRGKLYVVSRQQGKLNYSLLGNTSGLKVKLKLKRMSFKSLFAAAEPVAGRCDKKFRHIKTRYGEECLQLKSRNCKYAGLFEPLRYMAIKDMTAFAPGMDGMRFDEKTQRIHFSIQSQAPVSLAVGHDPALGSQYILREVP